MEVTSFCLCLHNDRPPGKRVKFSFSSNFIIYIAENEITSLSLPLLGEAEIRDLIPKVGPRTILIRNLEIYKKTLHPDCHNSVSWCLTYLVNGMVLATSYFVFKLCIVLFPYIWHAIIYRLVKIWTFQYQICCLIHLEIINKKKYKS